VVPVIPVRGPVARSLVLIGGGHTHALALQDLARRPLLGVRVVLVSDTSFAPYSGMLAGHIGGFYSWEEMHVDLRRLCAFAGATFVQGRVDGIDLAGREVRVARQPALAADVVSINVGSTPRREGLGAGAARVIPAKPVASLLAGWEAVTREASDGRQLRIVVVGAGAGGVELALAMDSKLAGRAVVTVVDQSPRILGGHPRRVQSLLERLLHDRGIALRTGSPVAEVSASSVRLRDRQRLDADFVFWVTAAGAPAWLAASGLTVDEKGFVRVSATLQSISHPWIFAVGDAASIDHHPRPKSGVFAVRMAAPLVDNLHGWFGSRPLRRYRPQRHALSLIGTGDGKAVASHPWLGGHSTCWWWLKDRIDRRFMAKLNDPPRRQTRVDDPSNGTTGGGAPL